METCLLLAGLKVLEQWFIYSRVGRLHKKHQNLSKLNGRAIAPPTQGQNPVPIKEPKKKRRKSELGTVRPPKRPIYRFNSIQTNAGAQKICQERSHCEGRSQKYKESEEEEVEERKTFLSNFFQVSRLRKQTNLELIVCPKKSKTRIDI